MLLAENLVSQIRCSRKGDHVIFWSIKNLKVKRDGDISISISYIHIFEVEN